MKAWKRYAPNDILYDGKQRVTLKHFTSEDGGVFDFETVGFGDSDAATVVAITSQGEAVIVKQFRVGPEQVMSECISGVIEPGEEPIDAAARELREETGYASDSISYLGSVHDGPYVNMKRHIFIAENCYEAGALQLDDTERVEVELIPIAELITNAKTGKMTNGIAVLFAYDRLLELSNRFQSTTN